MFAKRALLVSAGLVCLSQLPRTAAAQTFITAWGSYGSGDGQFLGTLGVAVGGSGQIYVLDSNDRRIQVFTSSGSFLRKWSYTLDGPAYPRDLAVDPDDNVYVTESNRIMKFTSTGTFLMEWGTNNLNLAMDASANLYAAGTDDSPDEQGTVAVLSPSGALLRVIHVGVSPFGVTVDASGNIYVLHYLGIQKYSSAGSLLTQWGSRGTGDGQFMDPVRAAVDNNGRVYVVDQGNSRVQVFTGDGTFLTRWGGPGAGPGQFDNPVGIALDSQGIYVADKNNSRIQKFSFAPTPVQSVSWGSMKARYRGAPGAAQPATQDR